MAVTRKVRGPTSRKQKTSETRSSGIQHAAPPIPPSADDGPLWYPTKAEEVPKHLEDFTIFIYGRKGVGKTSLASHWKNAMIFNHEVGRKNVSCKRINIHDFSLLERYMWDIAEGKRKVTPVIDTVDSAWSNCYRTEMAVWQLSSIRDAFTTDGFWARAKERFQQCFEPCLRNGIPIVFTGHFEAVRRVGKEQRLAGRFMHEFDEYEPSAGAAWKLLKVWCDIVVFYEYWRGTRSFIIRPDGMRYASPGPEDHFYEPDGSLLHEFPAGESHRDAWKTLNAAFNNKVVGYQDEVQEEQE